jgi:hypothetical protein
MKGQTLRHRAVLERWARRQCRSDFREGHIDGTLIALCVIVAAGAFVFLTYGGV